MLQLCDALWVLHCMGAVHRDIKPDNILLCGNQVVLIDFDASRLIKPTNDEDTQVLGTTGYAASGGSLGLERCAFQNNHTGVKLKTDRYTYFRGDFSSCLFEGNNIGF